MFEMKKRNNRLISAALSLCLLAGAGAYQASIAAAEELTPDYVTGNADGIIGDRLELPHETSSGTAISKWSSDDGESLFVGGYYAYPLAIEAQKEVSLTAHTVDGEQLPVQVIVPQKKENWITLAEQDFENADIGQLPSQQGGSWSRGGTTDVHAKSIGVQQEENGNKYMAINNKGIGVSAGDDLFAYFHVDTSKYDRVAVEYDIFINEGSSNQRFDAGSRFGQNTMLRTVVHPTYYWIQGEANAGGSHITQLNFKESPDEEDRKWNTLKTTFTQPETGRGYISVAINGKDRAISNGKFWLDGVRLKTIPFGTIRNVYVDMGVDNAKVSADIASPGLARQLLDSIRFNDLSSLTEDLNLPHTTPNGNSQIYWHSANPDLLSDTGVVTRPAEDQEDGNVSFYALIQYEGNWSYRKFDATVLRQMTDEEKVAADDTYIEMNVPALCKDNLAIRLKGPNGSKIQWISSHPEVIDPDSGKVTLPGFTGGALTEVTLTARAVSGDAEGPVHTFICKVPDNNLAFDAALSASSETENNTVMNAVDYDAGTLWKPDENEKAPYYQITFKKDTKVNKILLSSESGAELSYSTDGVKFTYLASGSSFDFAERSVKALRLTFPDGTAGLSEVGVYYVVSDEQSVKLDAEGIQIPESTSADIEIPEIGANGSAIRCVSDQPDVLTNTGKVTRQSSDKTVTLTFTVTKGEAVETTARRCTVLAKSAGSASRPSGSGAIGGGSGSSGGYTPAVPSAEPEPVNPPEPAGFTDIGAYGWAKEAIETFAAKGIVSGTGEGIFEPGRGITRAEFLKLLMEAFGIETGGASAEFADVPADSWAYPYVAKAYELGLVQGIGDGRFGAEAYISRADLSVMVRNALALKGELPEGSVTAFDDWEAIPPYAAEAVGTMLRLNAVSGFEDNTFRPFDTASRAQAVVILFRIAEYQS